MMKKIPFSYVKADCSREFIFSSASFFSLIELLVVVAIIGILVSMLLPALNSAKDKSKEISCLSNLKNIGNANQMYIADYDGYVNFQQHGNPSTAGFYGYWFYRAADYVSGGYKRSDWNPNTIWACPNQSPYSTYGWPSYGCSEYTVSGNPGMPVKITNFSMPSAKVQIMEDVRGTITRMVSFYADKMGGGLGFRHQNGKRINFSFYDGHAAGYSNAVVPYSRNDSIANRWISPNYDPPDGL